ncbi:MAG: serine/threonine-protein kinase [Pseudomonadota bacterium]
MLAVTQPTAGGATAAPAGSSNVLPTGTRLGEFEIAGVLGEGGFGIVYRAIDHSLKREVALKEYMPAALASRLPDFSVTIKSEQHRPTFEVGLKSFINEARLLAQFDHPALVKVFRFWAANGTAYMAMPLYEGGTLKQALKARAAPPDETWLRKLLVPLLDALELLHRADCLHRDISPDNILLVGGDRADPKPLLLDFGAARRVIGEHTQALTVILKPGFAPIEQYDEIPGMKQGPWTDLYALAAVVHFAITGRAPAPSVGRVVQDAHEPLARTARGRYGEAFLAAIDRALAPRPADRPQSVAEFRRSLAAAPPPAQGERSSDVPAAPPVPQRAPRVGRAIIWGAALGVALVAGAGVAIQAVRQRDERALAAASKSLAQPARPATDRDKQGEPAAATDAKTAADAAAATPSRAAETPKKSAPRPAPPASAQTAERAPASGATDAVDGETSRHAARPLWMQRALREGRDCLVARDFACTIRRAEAVLKADPEDPAAQRLLKLARAGQEAALSSDWKMR